MKDAITLEAVRERERERESYSLNKRIAMKVIINKKSSNSNVAISKIRAIAFCVM